MIVERLNERTYILRAALPTEYALARFGLAPASSMDPNVEVIVITFFSALFATRGLNARRRCKIGTVLKSNSSENRLMSLRKRLFLATNHHHLANYHSASTLGVGNETCGFYLLHLY